MSGTIAKLRVCLERGTEEVFDVFDLGLGSNGADDGVSLGDKHLGDVDADEPVDACEEDLLAMITVLQVGTVNISRGCERYE